MQCKIILSEDQMIKEFHEVCPFKGTNNCINNEIQPDIYSEDSSILLSKLKSYFKLTADESAISKLENGR